MIDPNAKSAFTQMKMEIAEEFTDDFSVNTYAKKELNNNQYLGNLRSRALIDMGERALCDKYKK